MGTNYYLHEPSCKVCGRGPMGLLRHKIGPHCIAHGAGTWDLIPGKFS